MRLAFAVAVAKKPEILLVDEILAVGDLKFQQKCLDRISRFIKEGTTLVMVSHRPEQLEKYTNLGLFLDNGKVTYFGDIKTAINRYQTFLKK